MVKQLFLVFWLVLLSACNKDTSLEKEIREIKIAVNEEPITFDPRQLRGLSGATYMHGLYEGLTRHDKEGNLMPGISLGVAERIEISEDQKTYRFFLREAHWSDGTRVKAGDFVSTWKTILSPHFPAPNSYQLYVIEGAKEYKENNARDFGAKAIDDNTLEVKLQQPTPYFLELLATHFYIPYKEKAYNGPFVLQDYKLHEAVIFEKNLTYWDKEKVHLDRIEFLILDENTLVEIFEKGEVDWIGSPQGAIPPDLISEVELEHTLLSNPALGTHLLRVNTLNPNLTDAKVRRALSLAVDRKAIVQYVTQGNHAPAWGIVPPSLGFVTAAQPVIKSPLNLPTITLSYAKGDRSHATAQFLQQQWQKNLGIIVKLDKCEHKCFVEKIKNLDYDVALGSWYGDYRDPYNFLELFKLKNISTNNTGWENKEFAKLLDQSSLESDPLQRKKMLEEAERILLNEAPIIPLYYGSFNSFKNPKLKDVYVSDLGYLDFKGAKLD